MTGREYEFVAADYLRRHGYHDVRVTRASGDYGVDLTCRCRGIRYAVQCKYYTHPVGISAVQQAVAGKAQYGCEGAMVITNSTLTRAAAQLAESNGVVVLQQVEQQGLSRTARLLLLACLWLLWLGGTGFCAIRAASGDTLWPLLTLLTLPPLFLLLRRLYWWLSLRRGIRHEERLRRLETKDRDDLTTCVELAERPMAALPRSAFQPAGKGPGRSRVMLFFPDSVLMKAVLQAVGDRPRFSLRTLERQARLTPAAARTLTDCLLKTGLVLCDKPGCYAWSRFSLPQRGRRD